MSLLNRKARFALNAAKTGVKTYGAAQRARGRAAGRRTTGGVRRGVAVGTALGGATAYLLEPREGARRRHAARDRALAVLRRRSRDATRRAEYAAGVARGVAHNAMPHRSDGPAPDDVTLARKVESIIFRPEDAPKGHVSVNTERGVVFLRGQVDSPEQIRRLVEGAADVEGVAAVENLLHLPGVPVPMKS